MKKRNLLIVCLLVLSMSVIFMGCPKEEEETFNPAVPSNVMSILRDQIGYKGDFFEPADTNYSTYWADKTSNATMLVISWGDADASKFTSYKAKWGSNVAASQARTIVENDGASLSLGTGLTARISFTVAGGESGGEDNFPVAANSIFFMIYK